MGTPLYSTDIIPMTSRPTLTVMDDGDYFVILDTSTGKISKILKTNVMTALKITYDNTSGLTAETVQAALDELVVNLGSSDSAILALAGRLDTLEGTVVELDHRIDNILEGQDLDPNKDVELLDARHSNVSDETYESLGKRLDGIDDSYNRMASWSAKRFGLRFYTDTGEFARIGDAVGMVHRNHAGSYTPGVYSDFSFEDPWGGIKPCKMNDNGQILGWHGDPGYELLDGDEMVFIPRVFTGWTAKVVGGRPCIDIEASPAQLPGLYPTGFIGSDGQLLRGIYVGRTKLGESGGTLVTKSGVAPKTNKSMVSFNTDIRAKGTNANWRLNDFASWMVVTTLMAIEIGTFDVKTAIGPGIQSGMPYGTGNEFKCTVSQTGANSIVIANAGATNMRVGMVMQVGTTYSNNSVAANRAIVSIEDYDVDNKRITLDGAAFDSVAGTTTIVSWGQPVPAENMDALNGESGYITRFDSSTRSNVCWRWMWDLWGNTWEWLAGILRVSGKFYISFDRDLHAETSPAGKAGWIDTGYTPIVENGYQKERQVITYNNGQISLPKTTGGSGVGANSWYAAYLYYFGADYQTSTRAVRVSGDWGRGRTFLRSTGMAAMVLPTRASTSGPGRSSNRRLFRGSGGFPRKEFFVSTEWFLT